MRNAPATVLLIGALAARSGFGPVAAAGMAGPAVAGDAPAAQADEKHGYWWYEKQADPDTASAVQKPEHPDLGPPPAEDQLLAMHPKEVEKMMDDYRDYALWKMTPEHVTWYYQLQDFARRRSQAFMNETQVVMLQTAALNMNTEYPKTEPGINAHAAQQQAEIDALLRDESSSAALILLSRQGCRYCDVQRNTLLYFQQKHPGWQVREVDVGEQPALKTKFSVDYTPTTVVIFRNTDQWFPVAVGVESVTGVEENVFRAVRMLKGETDPETFTLQESQQGGVMDPENGGVADPSRSQP